MRCAEFLLIHFECVVVALGLLSTSAIAADSQSPQALIPLLNGKDLTGWKGLVADPKQRADMSADRLAAAQNEADQRMRAHWKVVDGVLEFDGEGDNLCTLKDYGDFDLTVDWKIPAGSDSGIYLRGSPQVQIWDTACKQYWQLGADKGSGGLWNNRRNPRFPLARADKPTGQWNTFHIRMLGERATVKLNEQIVVDDVVLENYWDRDRPIYPQGSIELQSHGTKLNFRNILVHEIPPEVANASLGARDASKFQTIFNGRDFAGWTGDIDDYEVENGTIRCQPGQGGNIFTKQEYANFIARVEFKLPPGGNSGLAIRYPGTGRPSLSGMCEIQVIDSKHPKYVTLDPRQHHGSAYGMVPAHRGYLRPTGQWNFQQVTVQGSTIKVELNGFTILDTDLSQVFEFMDNVPHTEKDRPSGHFGFVGHDDPVAFRNIAICQLKPETELETQTPIMPTK